MISALDTAWATTDWTIRRYSEEDVAELTRMLGYEPGVDDLERLRVDTYSTSEVAGNLVTTAGWTRMTAVFNLGTGNLFSSTTVRLGAGDGAGSAAAGDTDLSASAGSTHRWFNLSTVTNPSGTTLQIVSAFASGDGNFAWNEFGMDIGTATVTAGATVNAVLFNHKTSLAQGTKASGQVWTATAVVTFT